MPRGLSGLTINGDPRAQPPLAVFGGTETAQPLCPAASPGRPVARRALERIGLGEPVGVAHGCEELLLCRPPQAAAHRTDDNAGGDARNGPGQRVWPASRTVCCGDNSAARSQSRRANHLTVAFDRSSWNGGLKMWVLAIGRQIGRRQARGELNRRSCASNRWSTQSMAFSANALMTLPAGARARPRKGNGRSGRMFWPPTNRGVGCLGKRRGHRLASLSFWWVDKPHERFWR